MFFFPPPRSRPEGPMARGFSANREEDSSASLPLSRGGEVVQRNWPAMATPELGNMNFW